MLRFELQRSGSVFLGTPHQPYVLFKAAPTNDEAKVWCADMGVIHLPVHEQVLDEYGDWALREARIMVARTIESHTEADYVVA